jgi:anti-sigma regulatory factor (Ser/Thr protein kinase)/anti-anti-sigma regulatory factor
LAKVRDRCAISVPADLDDASLVGFRARLDSLVAEAPREAVLDCSCLDHVTSDHVNTLWVAHNKCKEAGIPIRLSSVRCGLERVLKVLDLYDLFIVERAVGGQRREVAGGLREIIFRPVLRLDFRPVTGEVDEALNKFHDFLTRLNLEETCTFDLEIVFYEVATNIRMHGQLRETDAVAFVATPINGMISLQFIDSGPVFDPTGSESRFNPREAIRKEQRQGFGLVMIRRLADTIYYERIDDRLNLVGLWKELTWGSDR